MQHIPFSLWKPLVSTSVWLQWIWPRKSTSTFLVPFAESVSLPSEWLSTVLLLLRFSEMRKPTACYLLIAKGTLLPWFWFQETRYQAASDIDALFWVGYINMVIWCHV